MTTDEHDPMAAIDMLEQLRTAEQVRKSAEDALVAARHDRDELIRDALRQGYPAGTIAAAMGLHEQRIYQIRDKRR